MPVPTVPCYASGKPFTALHPSTGQRNCRADCRSDRVIRLAGSTVTWSRLWEIVARELERRGYRAQTVQAYRWVLRGLYSFHRHPPGTVTAATLRAYLDRLVDKGTSSSWIAVNISVLRGIFDKLGGMALTTNLQCPKRPRHLPDILSREEARALLAAAPTVRDQLLLGLLYGCGLKVGELRALRWEDIDVIRRCARVQPGPDGRQRHLELPADLLPVLNLGVQRCAPDQFVFPGRDSRTPLSTRTVELIVRAAREAAGIIKPVTAMTLRHAFAVHSLEAGETIRAVQEALGHRSVETTRRYEDCILPPGVVSPVDRLKRMAREQMIEADHASPRQDLYDEPPSVGGLDLPFAAATTTPRRSAASIFYTQLKTLIRDRFLCRRGATARSP